MPIIKVEGVFFMNKLVFALNATWMSAILLSMFSTQGMENQTQLALYEEKHSNNDYSLTSLPNEILSDIFSYSLSVDANHIKSIKTSIIGPACHNGQLFTITYEDKDAIVDSLKKSIKNCMKLSTMCKKFNTLLSPKTIGNFQKNYAFDTKNSLAKLLKYPSHHTYDLPILILVYAGAKYKSLLPKAILHEHVKLITVLLENKVDPNRDYCNQPAFFYADTKEVAEILVNGGANINAKATKWPAGQPNVLWSIVADQKKSELIQFYLDRGIDAHVLCSHCGTCILHALGNVSCPIKFPDRLLKQAKILLKALPDMINAIDRCGRTPLNNIQMFLKYEPVSKKLVKLFKKHGALTAQELAQQTQTAQKLAFKISFINQPKKDKNQNCIIS